MNVGEELCGEWLRHVRGCEFIQYNLRTTDVQGEIDVIAINLAERVVYACEVAVHLVTGLQYVGRDGKNDNVGRIASKFRKDVAFVRRAFPDYRHAFMLWSPVVKTPREGSANSQMRDVLEVVTVVREETGADVELVINERFQQAMDELRAVARAATKELDSPVMRMLQIEEHLGRFLAKERAKAG